MKRQILLLVLLALFAISCLGLAGCHECQFGEWETFITPTCMNGGTERRVCECGEVEVRDVPPTDHVYDEVIAHKDATCTDEGYVTSRCFCGKEQTTPIESTGHNYQEQVTQPTCTEQGYTTYQCSNCSHFYVDDYVAELGHDEQQHAGHHNLHRGRLARLRRLLPLWLHNLPSHPCIPHGRRLGGRRSAELHHRRTKTPKLRCLRSSYCPSRRSRQRTLLPKRCLCCLRRFARLRRLAVHAVLRPNSLRSFWTWLLFQHGNYRGISLQQKTRCWH